MNNVVANVAQHECNNNKYYASAFSNIEIIWIMDSVGSN